MDKRTKQIFENIKNNKLTADSSFMFHCTMCGDCCRNRDDIILNPNDLFNIAKGMKIRPVKVFEQYCNMYIGHTSRIPIIRLNSVGMDKHCVFLNEKLCSVQDFKPTVCAMFPIGRYYHCEKDNSQNGTVGYIFTNPNCGDKREIHIVREWLEKYGIPTNDEFFLKWTDTIKTLSEMVVEFEKHQNEARINLIWHFLCFSLYLNYDIDKEFMPQFLNNVELTIENLNKLINSK